MTLSLICCNNYVLANIFYPDQTAHVEFPIEFGWEHGCWHCRMFLFLNLFFSFSWICMHRSWYIMGEPLMSINSSCSSIITKFANHSCWWNVQLLQCKQCHTAYTQNMDMYGAFMNTNTWGDVLNYCVCSTFVNDFNLVVWWFWLWSPNLMYNNTIYNNMYYKSHEAMYAQYSLFVKLKCPPMYIMSQFAKLVVRQIYHAYGR